MIDQLLFVAAALFSVVNPLGTVPIFVSLSADDTSVQRNRNALLTALNTAIILIIAFFAGQYVLKFFGISIDALRIGGGLIILSSGFALLNGKFVKSKGLNKSRQKEAKRTDNIALTPLAMPMLAGPGSISLLITVYKEHPGWHNNLAGVVAVLLVCVSIYLILGSAVFIVKKLGENGINAISRIIGFIIIALGIEYISTGVLNLLKPILG
ncbi:MAG: MarC family NAAT transporter [Flavobacteriaceae bacterium]|nr:MarC family NAAT transporter [Flavobacteriaceae bacterium]